jgi:hypothetical protein
MENSRWILGVSPLWGRWIRVDRSWWIMVNQGRGAHFLSVYLFLYPVSTFQPPISQIGAATTWLREWSFHISIVELGECTWRLTSRDWNLKPCFGSNGMPQCQNIIIIDNPRCHPTILPSIVIHYPSIIHYLSINTAILLMIIHYSNHHQNA